MQLVLRPIHSDSHTRSFSFVSLRQPAMHASVTIETLHSTILRIIYHQPKLMGYFLGISRASLERSLFHSAPERPEPEYREK